MKGYSEWTSRSRLITELLSRQHQWQPERQRIETTLNRTKPKPALDEASEHTHTQAHKIMT